MVHCCASIVRDNFGTSIKMEQKPETLRSVSRHPVPGLIIRIPSTLMLILHNCDKSQFMLFQCLKTVEEPVPPNAMCLTPLTSKRVSFAVENEVRCVSTIISQLFLRKMLPCLHFIHTAFAFPQRVHSTSYR